EETHCTDGCGPCHAPAAGSIVSGRGAEGLVLVCILGTAGRPVCPPRRGTMATPTAPCSWRRPLPAGQSPQFLPISPIFPSRSVLNLQSSAVTYDCRPFDPELEPDHEDFPIRRPCPDLQPGPWHRS